MVAVESSAVEAVGYDAERRELRIRFTGGAVYAYVDVPQDTYRAFLDADSKGTFVNCEIKPRFRYRRL